MRSVTRNSKSHSPRDSSPTFPGTGVLEVQSSSPTCPSVAVPGAWDVSSVTLDSSLISSGTAAPYLLGQEPHILPGSSPTASWAAAPHPPAQQPYSLRDSSSTSPARQPYIPQDGGHSTPIPPAAAAPCPHRQPLVSVVPLPSGLAGAAGLRHGHVPAFLPALTGA